MFILNVVYNSIEISDCRTPLLHINYLPITKFKFIRMKNPKYINFQKIYHW